MKTLREMTKRELLQWAEANGYLLSTTTKAPRSRVEAVLRLMISRRLASQDQS